MNEFVSSYYGELYRHGVKGQKWGVRRYQNSDGSLTLEGKKRYYNKDGSLNPVGKGKSVELGYRLMGTSKSLAKRHGYYTKLDARDIERINTAINNLNANRYTDKQVKRLAKDYETAVNGLKTMMARDSLKSVVDANNIAVNDRAIARFRSKKNQNDRVKRKIDELITDNEFMELNMLEIADRAHEYKSKVDSLVKNMSEDKRLVYRTKDRALAYLAENGSTDYTAYGTKYKIKSNTKSRANSKTYTDPMNKKEYGDTVVKRNYYYY